MGFIAIKNKNKKTCVCNYHYKYIINIPNKYMHREENVFKERWVLGALFTSPGFFFLELGQPN